MANASLLRYQDIGSFIQEKVQALNFCFFWFKPKEEEWIKM
jgi:hypothetical protein